MRLVEWAELLVTAVQHHKLMPVGTGELVVADTADLGRPAVLADDDVRTAAASATHVVVATSDAVRAYAREG